jgi:hypothetical protein
MAGDWVSPWKAQVLHTEVEDDVAAEDAADAALQEQTGEQEAHEATDHDAVL